VCTKSFTRAYYLQQHMLTNRDDNPNTCDVCKKSFCTVASLKKTCINTPWS